MTAMPTAPIMEQVIPAPVLPDRCVIIMDEGLTGGLLANAIAVIALTVGQRHPALVGEPLVDASSCSHPGLIPIGIPMLYATQNDLKEIRNSALSRECDVVDFPIQGQQTKNYQEFLDIIAKMPTDSIDYTGIAIIGRKNVINKLTRNLKMM